MAIDTPPGGWEKWTEDAQRAAGLLRDEQPRPRVQEANAALLLRLIESRALEFGGYVFRVPPVPFELGLRLHLVKEAWEEATAANDHARMSKVFAEGARLMRRCVRPRKLRQRIVWALLPMNPFKRASVGEFLHLMTFFLASRMISNIRAPSEEPIKGRRQSSTTSAIRGRNSVRSSPH